MTGYTVYWQPGCSSCLKVKELLRSNGIAFEQVNVREHPEALERLRALGAHSVPVVTEGERFTFGQDLDAVARFVGLDLQRTTLAPAVLVSKLMALLDIAAYYARLLPADAATMQPVGRDRNHLDLGYHIPQVVIGFLDAALGGRLTHEHFARRAPAHITTGGDVAALIKSVAQSFAVWWAGNQQRLPTHIDTYYGRQPLGAALERTAWHVAQHVRQLESVLAQSGVQEFRPLTPAVLEGLPLPDAVWNDEVERD